MSHLAVITFALVATAGLGHESLPSLASCFGLTAIMLAARNGWRCGVQCGTRPSPAVLSSIILRLEEGYRAACKVTDFIRRANHLTGAPPPPLPASLNEDHMDEGSPREVRGGTLIFLLGVMPSQPTTFGF